MREIVHDVSDHWPRVKHHMVTVTYPSIQETRTSATSLPWAQASAAAHLFGE